MKHYPLHLEQENYSTFLPRRNLSRQSFVNVDCEYLLMEAKCVDRYIQIQVHAHDDPSPSAKDTEMYQYDERLEAVVKRMFERCIEDKKYKQVHCFLPSS
jgi:hypothetical protein